MTDSLIYLQTICAEYVDIKNTNQLIDMIFDTEDWILYIKNQTEVIEISKGSIQ